jgi:hypothetical protein
LCYPFLGDNPNLRHKLQGNKVYCPLYWPNVLEWASADSLEYKLASEVVYLPIDQRYRKEDMEIIASLITDK